MTYPKGIDLDPRVLKPNPWNTNIMTPENEAKLEASVRRLGFFRPAVVREFANGQISEFQILGGQHRVEIAIKIGLATIPVVNLGPIDDLKAKEIGIADNARYGVDDTLAFAELLKEMGNADQLADFLPYTQSDFDGYFASAEIDLDSLEFEENFDRHEESQAEPDPELPKAPKTHTIVRFKVALKDAEEITALIERTKKTHGLTTSDELTNAGDALVQLLFSAGTSNELEDLELGEDE
jgi:ParB-like chromosome segregation protein Spo0J